jgi:phosphate transport system protein
MLVREHFEKDLRHLQDEILRLGSEVEDNLFTAVEALQKRDLARSQQLIEADRWVNELQLSLTMESLTLIATQQPAAKDLRFIATVMSIANELERIHDYLKGIGRISLMIGTEPIAAGLVDEFPLMAEKIASMLHRSLDALVNRDAQLARAVAADDDVVDELFNIGLNKMNAAIAQNQASFEEINRLGWANHNLERSADRVCNICEWVSYTVTGKFEEFA